ncbi:hypothetical protein H1C71_012526, partial [Ictidomys tridecemlineatus]
AGPAGRGTPETRAPSPGPHFSPLVSGNRQGREETLRGREGQAVPATATAEEILPVIQLLHLSAIPKQNQKLFASIIQVITVQRISATVLYWLSRVNVTGPTLKPVDRCNFSPALGVSGYCGDCHSPIHAVEASTDMLQCFYILYSWKYAKSPKD